MACGVTKNGVVCDNPGATNHTGPHSGIKTAWGYSLRFTWYANDFTPVILKRALPGVRARNDQAVLEVGSGTVPLIAAGMNLTTRYLLNSSWTRPTGWGARSGFTDVVINNNSLVMNSAGNVRVHVRGDATAAFGATINKRLVKNGTVLQTWNNDVENDHTFDTAVVAEDELYLEFNSSGGFGSSYIENNTGTYIYTEVLP